jgi:glycosyltransferase involved in cell wall biosynthesis
MDQTFKDFEIVVVDDCSSDRTVSVVRSFSNSRIRLIQNPQNLGLGENWNKALSCVRGKYVKLLCGDDLLHPECLAQQVEVLEQPGASGVVLAVCNRNIVNSGNRNVLRRRFPRSGGRISGAKLIRKSIRWGSNLIGEPAVGLFRREALARTNSCDPSNPYAIDLGLWAELLKHGDAFIDETTLASFRISARGASARIGLRQAAHFRQFVRKLRKDSFYRISLMDAVSGCLLSVLWCGLRNAFIRIHSNSMGKGRDTGFQPAVSPISNRQRVENFNNSQAGSPAIQQVGNLRYEGKA